MQTVSKGRNFSHHGLEPRNLTTSPKFSFRFRHLWQSLAQQNMVSFSADKSLHRLLSLEACMWYRSSSHGCILATNKVALCLLQGIRIWVDHQSVRAACFVVRRAKPLTCPQGPMSSETLTLYDPCPFSFFLCRFCLTCWGPWRQGAFILIPCAQYEALSGLRVEPRHASGSICDWNLKPLLHMGRPTWRRGQISTWMIAHSIKLLSFAIIELRQKSFLIDWMI